MMVQKPDWTKQLGQAFTSNRTAVFDSIQRLRAEAQAAGNLKTTSQQQVQTETTSAGQQVIVIEPANPQVVYVPSYNPQTVYVSSPSYGAAAAAGAIGFTAGVIIGASSHHYYYGPYGWHGAAMYDEAWDHREDYLEERQDMYQERQSGAQDRQSQRQTGSKIASRSVKQGSKTARHSELQADAASDRCGFDEAGATSIRSGHVKLRRRGFCLAAKRDVLRPVLGLRERLGSAGAEPAGKRQHVRRPGRPRRRTAAMSRAQEN